MTTEVVVTQTIPQVTVTSPVTMVKATQSIPQVAVTVPTTVVNVTRNVPQVTIQNQGAQGIPGPQGIPGASVGALAYTQNTPYAVWAINHNLGIYPTVVIMDSANNQCEGLITYVNTNNLTITFSAAFSGIAYLN